jgi:hypothetical protein
LINGWICRCIVTPFCFQDTNAWMYEFERTLGSLLKQCLVSIIRGSVTSLERNAETWLDSPLFRGGLQQSNYNTQHMQFIDDFINNKPDTNANRFISFMEKQVPPNPAIDRIGGNSPLLQKALRCYIIAIIKHSGLLDLAMKAPTQKTPSSHELIDQFIKIWLEARKLRQWIGSRISTLYYYIHLF